MERAAGMVAFLSPLSRRKNSMQHVFLKIVCVKTNVDFQIDVKGIKVGQILHPSVLIFSS